VGVRRRPRVPERVGPGDALAAARGITASLGGRTVLHDVTVEARAGEVLALVGPNGAGKSTLLAVLTGDLPPDAGVVEALGRPLATYAPTELARCRAVLPQSVTVTFPFTVTEVVRMGRAPWLRTPAAELDDAVVAAALRETDAAGFADRSYSQLSGGERARVALARVLAQSTQLLLLDEPTAALDLHHQEALLGAVRRRVDQGDGAVVVLHDLGLAAAHADRIAVLRAGHVVAEGPPAGVLQPDLLSEVYQHAIEVVAHPTTGAPLVVPIRERAGAAGAGGGGRRR
jgi:iron complex transport system ATP-binding protein